MKLIEQIYLEMDDIDPQSFISVINETFPNLKLEDEVSAEISEQLSDIMVEYAK
jgi:hypothetical protein